MTHSGGNYFKLIHPLLPLTVTHLILFPYSRTHVEQCTRQQYNMKTHISIHLWPSINRTLGHSHPSNEGCSVGLFKQCVCESVCRRESNAQDNNTGVARLVSRAAALINTCWTCWHCVIAWKQTSKWQRASSTALATAVLLFFFTLFFFLCVLVTRTENEKVTPSRTRRFTIKNTIKWTMRLFFLFFNYSLSFTR